MADDLIRRQDAIKEIARWIGYIDKDMILRIQTGLKKVPSAQPEIIRCKDCKFWHREIYNGIEFFNFSSCNLNHYGDGNNFYCADGERRTT